MLTQRKLRAAVAVTTLSLILAACGQDDTTDQPTDEVETPEEAPEEQTPDDPEEAAGPDDPEANAADAEFAQGMIPHHVGAIEMSELVSERTERQELIDLAERIVAAQDAEIDQLRGMLDRMGAEEMAMEDMGDMGDMGDMDEMPMGDMGMMDEQGMEELRGLEGEEFERRFLEGMIEHHEGAIGMAERVQAEGSDPEVAGLAEGVIAAQEAEIEQMNQWLDEWDLA